MKMSDDIDDNYSKTIGLIKKASEENADLICFPEIQLSKFFPQYENYDANEYLLLHDSKYIKGIRKACAKYKIYASPNIYLKENNQNYDASLLIDDDGNILGCQKMVHVAQFPKFYEQSYYTPSDDGFKVFETKYGKIGIVVCFDRHYPESIRTQSLKGADLIIIPTANTTDEPCELFQWEVKVQAFQNTVNIAMCNRCGVEDEMEFCGQSLITDYNGKTVALAGNNDELLIGDVDLNIKNKKYLSLRRKELYE